MSKDDVSVKELLEEMREDRKLFVSAIAALVNDREGHEKPIVTSTGLEMESGLQSRAKTSMRPVPVPVTTSALIELRVTEEETGIECTQTMRCDLQRRHDEADFTIVGLTPVDQTKLDALIKDNRSAPIRDALARAIREGDTMGHAALIRARDVVGVPGWASSNHLKWRAGWLLPMRLLVGKPWKWAIARNDVELLEGEVPPPRDVAQAAG